MTAENLSAGGELSWDTSSHGDVVPVSRSVYCLIGVPPEVQAYAMAKYSRSSQSMLDSVRELSSQRAERFLQTYYFEYGHRSIADLAHVVVAIENISILAAIRVVDEQLWDGQERSTRYQNFRRTGFEVPVGLSGSVRAEFVDVSTSLFEGYQMMASELTRVLLNSLQRPDGMQATSFERTVRARAFDLARQLLPLATRTSLGQVVSARVLERQINRLLADPYPEVREIGRDLKTASQAEGESPSASYPEPVRAAPTLVRYTTPSGYVSAARGRVKQLADETLASLPAPDRAQMVELADDEGPIDEMVATLLYWTSQDGHSYRQIQRLVRGLPDSTKSEIINASLVDRGKFDEMLRIHQTGYALKYDFLISIGAFRDLHRHRRCVQIVQDFTLNHGYQDPAWAFERAGGGPDSACSKAGELQGRYTEILSQTEGRIAALRQEHPEEVTYLLPLATRVRALFKMDFAQAAYMIELRSAPAGHFEYREAAWQMYEALHEKAPAFAARIRVSNPRQEIDLLRR